MKLTRKSLEKLSKQCKYNPEKIGACILRCLGYNVKFYIYSDSVCVSDKKEKILFFS